MKTLFKHIYGLIAMLLFCLTVTIFNAQAGPRPKDHHLISKELKAEVSVQTLFIKTFVRMVYDSADVTEKTQPLQPYNQVQAVPVNDAKPDNTNWQIIRESHLKVRQMESNV